MATTDAVLKPDHASRRKHFIFTDEHEQLRESIGSFVERELAPHWQEWEETTFPDWVFRRMGELGFLGLSYPEEYGGQGGDYYSNLVLAEEMTHCNSGGLAMGVVVDMDLPGVIREQKLEKLGMHSSDTALLAFQDVRVPEEALLGQEGKGFYHIMWELQGERLIGAAGCVAGAQKCFDRTLGYATDRTAFGRPIGKFQAIRHKFADMATKIEAGRQMVYTTAWRFANGEYPVREISMAKLYTARMACEVIDECLQIHGGAGYMKEYGIERAWRDMRLNRIGAGTDEIMLDVIGRSFGL